LQKALSSVSVRDALYARKGIVGRIGPVVVHVGIVIILMGEFGEHDWLLGQEMVPSAKLSSSKHCGRWTLGSAQFPKIGSCGSIAFGLTIRPQEDRPVLL